MKLARALALAILAALISSPALPGQTFTVDANDARADFQSLATAFASVPAGATLLLSSDMNEDTGNVPVYWLRQDVTVIGVGDPTIHGDCWMGAAVVLRDLRLDARRKANTLGTMICLRDSQVLIDGVEVLAAPDFITVRVAEAGAFLFAEESLIQTDGDVWAAVELTDPEAVFMAHASRVEHLGRGDAVFVERGTMYHSGSSFAGAIASGGGRVEALPYTMKLANSTLRIGDTAQLKGSGTPGGPVLLFLALNPPEIPVRTSVGPWFIATPQAWVRSQFDASGIWSLSARLPNDPNLIGLPLSLHQYDVAGRILSAPEAGILRN